MWDRIRLVGDKGDPERGLERGEGEGREGKGEEGERGYRGRVTDKEERIEARGGGTYKCLGLLHS